MRKLQLKWEGMTEDRRGLYAYNLGAGVAMKGDGDGTGERETRVDRWPTPKVYPTVVGVHKSSLGLTASQLDRHPPSFLSVRLRWAS